MKDNISNPVYSSNTLEFVTVASQYCVLMEQCGEKSRKDFIHTLLKLLPLLYLKWQMLPTVEAGGNFLPDAKVTEDDYDYILNTAYSVIGNADEYEELIYEVDMETEESQWKSVSEDLADLYQGLRNFVLVYQERLEPCMPDAIADIKDKFADYLGQTLLCTLKHLHNVAYSTTDIDDEEDFE